MHSVKLLIVLSLLFAAGTNTQQQAPITIEKTIKQRDTTPKVTGIGGIFFETENPDSIMAWYHQNLGLAETPYGSPFEFRNAHRPEEINYLEWSPFKKGSAYLKPSNKSYMINYRVQNIKGLVRQLEAKGVKVLDTIAVYEYGSFVHIMDPEGTKIELWEPIDSVFTKMGGPTTK